MAELQDAMPVSWASGPLEVAKRGKTGTLTAEVRQTLERWHAPAALDVLRGSPFNCLVVSWAAGLPEDAAQQKTLGPLVEAARKLNLAVVGWTEGSIDHNAAITSAKAAGLSAIALQNFNSKSDFPVIAWGERATAPWGSGGPVLAVTGNVWPGVSVASGGGDANAGPTALPWLDSNSWYLQMARARVPTPVWLVFDPPGRGVVVLSQRYVTAICDSQGAGGRWMISLDDGLRSGLISGNASARACWEEIGRTAAFFESRREWRSYRSIGLVGVISDFTGENYEMSGEILNLMARRDLLFRVIWKSQASAQPFTGLKALMYADTATPAQELRRKMLSFVEQGGLLVTNSNWGPEGKPVEPEFTTQFDVRAYGKGRLAVAKKELSDPYQVALDTQLLLGHRSDLVKFYNSSSSGCTLFTASLDGKRALLQGLSFASGRSGGGQQMAGLKTVWVRQKYQRARLWSIGAQLVSVQAEPAEEYVGVEYHLPETANAQPYFALEFEI